MPIRSPIQTVADEAPHQRAGVHWLPKWCLMVGLGTIPWALLIVLAFFCADKLAMKMLTASTYPHENFIYSIVIPAMAIVWLGAAGFALVSAAAAFFKSFNDAEIHRTMGRSGLELLSIILSLLIIWAAPRFFSQAAKARSHAIGRCVANLRQIDVAKQQWGLEYKVPARTTNRPLSKSAPFSKAASCPCARVAAPIRSTSSP
jgi:hypothetical protein